ncbi:BadF/BadG/BcrA/BcrD ATPase family protein [Actibacterium pelagium]|uniref:ATPase BadF/BadG/BcrA/BcrD type domain-containing protein n=1 Tax=Actibacterium pelagium TaxID=2029103 RepID=A0A917EJU9_9RHOB|nr:BadF/BadG/BcrA/BcrD ATPase family protein [Actibacterium pelagium]GGE50847.1 hypothetical protein GCM10011517_18260 [Actibacterium pelagium]
MKIAGIDIGSTTVKGIVFENGKVLWESYWRHNTRQAEKTLELLEQMESEAAFQPQQDQIVFTGSGAELIAPLAGGKVVQEVVAVAAAVDALHPNVRFVSEIGGEDMKTLFFTESEAGKSKQVYMQSACSGGTGTFIEKSARKLKVSSERLCALPYMGKTLHRISAKCGIFAETDANSLVKAGVPEDEIIASLFEAVVHQNLATLTKGNTPIPEVLLLGGPNMFFKGLQEAWVAHLTKLWAERGVELPADKAPEDLITVPKDALYYACRGCVEVALADPETAQNYTGTEKLRWWIEEGQHEAKSKEGATALAGGAPELKSFKERYGKPSPGVVASVPTNGPVFVGCDFGSTTVKAVALDGDANVVASCYRPSDGNPIEDARAIFGALHQAGVSNVGGLGVTGYGKDLLKDIIGADVPVVETVAHATAALHFVPDADAICDVGGCDVKIMLLRQNTVSDFRLNSQCSSGNGAFLQGVAERYDIPLNDYAETAFSAKQMPALMMGCGVFLQSDIVNQQRKGWSAEEIMASLASVLPLNVWVYAGQFQNLKAAGKKFVLQGGTHRNLAVVKAQVDFIESRVPGAKVIVHPYSGEAGAIGAALLAKEHGEAGLPTQFRGWDTIEGLTYVSTTNDKTTCRWCTMNCKRAFIDVELPDALGRSDSAVPLAPGWARVITGNSCPKGLVEDKAALRSKLTQMEDAKHDAPDISETVRETAFR